MNVFDAVIDCLYVAELDRLAYDLIGSVSGITAPGCMTTKLLVGQPERVQIEIGSVPV